LQQAGGVVREVSPRLGLEEIPGIPVLYPGVDECWIVCVWVLTVGGGTVEDGLVVVSLTIGGFCGGSGVLFSSKKHPRTKDLLVCPRN
jgi:hypothetical protein